MSAVNCKDFRSEAMNSDKPVFIILWTQDQKTILEIL